MSREREKINAKFSAHSTLQAAFLIEKTEIRE